MSTFDKFDLHVLTPAKVAELTGISPENVRVWRNRQYLTGYGQQSDGGRWLYSLKDALGLWVASSLDRANYLSDFRQAQVFSSAVLFQLFANLFQDKPGARYIVRHFKDGKYQLSQFSEGQDWSSISGSRFEVFDIHRMTEEIPPELSLQLMEIMVESVEVTDDA